MIRMAFAIAVAAFIFAAGVGVSRAAPIAPLPAGVRQRRRVRKHHPCVVSLGSLRLGPGMALPPLGLGTRLVLLASPPLRMVR